VSNTAARQPGGRLSDAGILINASVQDLICKLNIIRAAATAS
jgi:hypothetical protein